MAEDIDHEAAEAVYLYSLLSLQTVNPWEKSTSSSGKVRILLHSIRQKGTSFHVKLSLIKPGSLSNGLERYTVHGSRYTEKLDHENTKLGKAKMCGDENRFFLFLFFPDDI